jgi:hypothetical protein
MAAYSPNELNKRKGILDSQKDMIHFLDINIINKLIHLFDEYPNNYVNKNDNIQKYIEDERKARGLDNSLITFKREVYGNSYGDPTLHVGIIKNGIDFVHLSIHLAVKDLKPKNSGIIHFAKNIYKTGRKKKFYSLISVKQPPNKLHSLQFTAEPDSKMPNKAAMNQHNDSVQEEIDVIITVLNRLFDEDNKMFYIGDSKNTNQLPAHIFPIHKKTDNYVNIINKHTTHTQRKNRGKKMNSFLNSNLSPIKIIRRTSSAKNPRRPSSPKNNSRPLRASSAKNPRRPSIPKKTSKP